MILSSSSTIAKSKIVVKMPPSSVIMMNLVSSVAIVTEERRKGLVWARLSALALGIKEIFMVPFYHAGLESVRERSIFSFHIAFGRASYMVSPSVSPYSVSFSPYSAITGTLSLLSWRVSVEITSPLPSFHLQAFHTGRPSLSWDTERPKRRHTRLRPS